MGGADMAGQAEEELEIKLEDLAEGLHTLSGVEPFTVPNSGYMKDEDANGLLFELDGKTYGAFENPEDGYRSCLDRLVCFPNIALSHTFAPITVWTQYETSSPDPHKCDDPGECEVLSFYAVPAHACPNITSEWLVLQVGTRATDDYYPWFVAHFDPKVLERCYEEEKAYAADVDPKTGGVA
jgi:hypothetical protein